MRKKGEGGREKERERSDKSHRTEGWRMAGCHAQSAGLGQHIPPSLSEDPEHSIISDALLCINLFRRLGKILFLLNREVYKIAFCTRVAQFGTTGDGFDMQEWNMTSLMSHNLIFSALLQFVTKMLCTHGWGHTGLLRQWVTEEVALFRINSLEIVMPDGICFDIFVSSEPDPANCFELDQQCTPKFNRYNCQQKR